MQRRRGAGPALVRRGRAEHIATLMASCAELSTLSRNVHRLTALLRQANVEPARPYREMLDTLAGDVRRHLELAAHVLADLQPQRRDDGTWAFTDGAFGGVSIGEVMAANNVIGFATYGELLERYANRTGRDLSGIDYYVAFSCWRLAVISEGVYARYRGGAMGAGDFVADDGADALEDACSTVVLRHVGNQEMT